MSALDRPSRFIGVTLTNQGGSLGSNAVDIAECANSFVQVIARKGRETDVVAAIRQHFGLDLPDAGRVASADRCTAIWLQPGGWLLQAPAIAGEAFIAAVRSALAGLAAVIDQSHGRAVLRLQGAHARDILQKCCRLDFHPRVFAVGHSAGTLIGHVACVIHQVDDAPTFELIVGSTYAVWLLEDLCQAATPFGWRFRRAETQIAGQIG